MRSQETLCFAEQQVSIFSTLDDCTAMFPKQLCALRCHDQVCGAGRTGRDRRGKQGWGVKRRDRTHPSEWPASCRGQDCPLVAKGAAGRPAEAGQARAAAAAVAAAAAARAALAEAQAHSSTQVCSATQCAAVVVTGQPAAEAQMLGQLDCCTALPAQGPAVRQWTIMVKLSELVR